MKKIQSQNHKKLEADLIDHPPVADEEENNLIKDKKKKRIYQLGLWVDDIDINEVVE